ncbi:MAG: insulinase family protein [Bacteroidales bacterium]|nr:insulinase family protein [Bacteroidales bacterium]
MTDYRTHHLDNGLTVITHRADDTPMASVSLLYGVGSRDEHPSRTGFAHLFEHLMFGGTPSVPDFDSVVSSAGGECNAFTTNDYTDYHMTLPASALGTALRLEADRMANLDISQRALEVQQHVVTEEYHQRYLNAAYGDLWLLLRPLCYTTHPYRWPTIGADISHVGEATLGDVRAFHSAHYRPGNAILAIAAPLEHDDMLAQAASAWSCGVAEAGITPTAAGRPAVPAEPMQREPRHLDARRQVPSTKVYLAYHMPDHFHPLFRACDLITDLLGSGDSSRLHRSLVLEKELCTSVNAFITGDIDAGLLVLSATLKQGVEADRVADELRGEASLLASRETDPYELRKVQNRYENTFVFSQYKAADRALALCYYSFLGDASLIDREPELYHAVSADDIQTAARMVFDANRENSLFYMKS